MRSSQIFTNFYILFVLLSACGNGMHQRSDAYIGMFVDFEQQTLSVNWSASHYDCKNSSSGWLDFGDIGGSASGGSCVRSIKSFDDQLLINNIPIAQKKEIRFGSNSKDTDARIELSKVSDSLRVLYKSESELGIDVELELLAPKVDQHFFVNPSAEISSESDQHPSYILSWNFPSIDPAIIELAGNSGPEFFLKYIDYKGEIAHLNLGSKSQDVKSLDNHFLLGESFSPRNTFQFCVKFGDLSGKSLEFHLNICSKAARFPNPLPPTHLIFATEQFFNGNIGGLDQADQICEEEARDAGLEQRTWKALLSTSFVDARDRIEIKGDIGNTNGEWVTRSDYGLFYQISIFSPKLRYTASGTSFAEPFKVWTGSDKNGRMRSNCRDWHSSESLDYSIADYGAIVDINETQEEWARIGGQACAEEARIFCLSQ